MGNFKGFVELKKPSDLLKKLEFDFNRLQEKKNDQYVAFDFFVTAEHIVDWIHPTKSDSSARKSLRSSNALLKIVSHIANGAKHFEATAPHHQSIDHIKKDRYVKDGYVEEGYLEEPIIIKFTPAEASAFGKSEIDVLELAEKVLKYWQSQNIA